MRIEFPNEVFIKKADLCDGHMRKANATFSGNCYISVNPWACFDMSDSVKYIRHDKLDELENENAELKEMIDLYLPYYQDRCEGALVSATEHNKLKARLAHVGSELRASDEFILKANCESDNEEYKENPDYWHDVGFEKELSEIAKRARQRIKERKDFNAN